MGRYSKHKATVMISDPVAVASQYAAMGGTYDNGAIFCSIPEAGLEGMDLVYCRYGLSIPYIRVQDGWYLWVEPTIDEDQRWIYTGIADAGGETVDPTIQMAITLLSGILYAKTAGTLHLTSPTALEAFVLGTTLKVELQKIVDALTQLNSDFTTWSVVAQDGGAALKAKVMAGFTTKAQAVLTSILSTKIFGA